MNNPIIQRKRMLKNNHKRLNFKTSEFTKIRLKTSEVKSLETNSSSVVSKLSNDKYPENIHVNNDEATIPFENCKRDKSNQELILPNELERNNIEPSTIPKIKTSKSVSSVKKKKIINNVNKDNDCDGLEKSITIKSSKFKTKISKSIFSYEKKSEVDKINKNDKPDEFKISNNSVSSKVSNKTSESRTPAKKKSVVNNLSENNKPFEIENTDNIVTSKMSKSKEHKSLETSGNSVSLKISKNKSSKSVIFTKKKNSINNLGENNKSIEIGNNDNIVTSKTSKSKASKSVSSTKKKCELKNVDVNENSKYNELKRTNDFPFKVRYKNLDKNTTSVKKKSVEDNVNKNGTPIELDESNDNIVTSKTSKSKASKSVSSTKKKCELKNVDVNENSKYNELERTNDYPLKFRYKNLNKNTTSVKKKSVEVNVNKNDTPIELDESNYLVNFRKRGRPLTKKIKLQKTYAEVCDVYKNEDEMILSQNLDVDDVIKVQSSTEIVPCKNKDDNKKLGSKTLNIKKKWTDEWREDKSSSHDVLETNCDDSLGDSHKIIMECIQTQKPENSNHEKITTNMIENFDPVINNMNNSFDTEKSITTLPVTQNYDNSLTVNSIPSTESAVSNVITESVKLKAIDDVPYNHIETTCPTEITIDFIESNKSSLPHGNDQTSHLSGQESMFDPNCSQIPMIGSEFNELNYGMAILSEAISRQCKESLEKNIKMKSPEKDVNEVQSSSSDKTDCNFKTPVTSSMISSKKSKKPIKNPSKSYKQSIESGFQSRFEQQIFHISKRFNLTTNDLKKAVVEEPLTVFHKMFSKSVNTSMFNVSPVEKEIELHTKTRKYVDLKYNLEPIEESSAHEMSNLKDLMTELSKSMPSWSLSIVNNPPRYVISQMTIDIYGIPFATKCIVLDKSFRASVFINSCLKYIYCKRYTTAIEIINLIKELNSLY